MSEKICVQKILPHHKHLVDKINQNSGPVRDHLAAAFYTSKIWPAYTEIFVTFTDKDPSIIRTDIASMKTTNGPPDPLQIYFSKNTTIPIPKAIEKIVKERIEPIVNLKFTFTDLDGVKGQKNHVRISFDSDGGSWSLVGTDAVGYEGATMNLGWFDVSTVMHEFGHVMGMIHEHQNPRGDTIKWNDKAVYEWADQTQGWTHKQTDTNIINKYAINQINGSKFDPLSIMLYFFPANLTTNNEGTSQNLRLSGDDALWLNKTYPGSPETPSVYYPKVYGMTLQKSIDKSKSMKASSNSKIWIWIILLIAVLLIIFLIWKFIL